jgi:hypothetical protein
LVGELIVAPRRSVHALARRDNYQLPSQLNTAVAQSSGRRGEKLDIGGRRRGPKKRIEPINGGVSVVLEQAAVPR